LNFYVQKRCAWQALATLHDGALQYSLLRSLLTPIFTPFHIEIGGSADFAQLPGVLLGGDEPAVQAFLELHRRRCGQCA